MPPQPHSDIELQDGMTVAPGGGGMSVAPHDPLNLARHRRPPEFGGEGPDPVWEYPTSEEMGRLYYRSDTRQDGMIEPSAEMLIADYESALEGTQDAWVKI